MSILEKIPKEYALLLCALLLTGCSIIDAGNAKPSAEAAQEKIIPVNVAAAEVKTIKKELSYPGQAQASEQIAVMGKLAGKVDQVYFKTGDYVNAGDVLYTMEAIDIENNIKALEAQLETADAAVRAAETGVALADGSATHSQILQASGGVEQAFTGLQQAEKNVEQALLSVEQAQLGVNQAQLAVEQTQFTIDQAQLAVEQRELALDQAQVVCDDARSAYDDTTALYDAGAIPKAQYDQAETGHKNAELALSQARAALEAAKSGLEQAKSGQEQAKASLEQAKSGHNVAIIALEQAKKSYSQAQEGYEIAANEVPAESLRRADDALTQAVAQKNSIMVSLTTAQEKLGDTSITAPISGLISARNIEPQTMLSGAAPPFIIVRTDIIEVSVNVTEVIVNNLATGQRVPVSINAASSQEFEAEIVTLAPAASQATAAFEVRLAIENKDNLIKPGMYAEARFVREQAENSVVLPRSAVLSEQAGQFVYTADSASARKVLVTTGIDNGQEIEITSGIVPGDQIVIKGQNYLNDGAKIEITESGGPLSAGGL
ncbi:MAG: efflux RND transporter periplasmic adaptor subunit [Clostridiales bacterium]|nr:efflux RND transporter periplasmic adaptor subunit [Clostridiales bacterium]